MHTRRGGSRASALPPHGRRRFEAFGIAHQKVLIGIDGLFVLLGQEMGFAQLMVRRWKSRACGIRGDEAPELLRRIGIIPVIEKALRQFEAFTPPPPRPGPLRVWNRPAERQRPRPAHARFRGRETGLRKMYEIAIIYRGYGGLRQHCAIAFQFITFAQWASIPNCDFAGPRTPSGGAGNRLFRVCAGRPGGLQVWQTVLRFTWHGCSGNSARMDTCPVTHEGFLAAPPRQIAA